MYKHIMRRGTEKEKNKNGRLSVKKKVCLLGCAAAAAARHTCVSTSHSVAVCQICIIFTFAYHE